MKFKKQDTSAGLVPDQEVYSIYSLRYPLSHPRTTQVFYVGMAADPHKRFIQHLQFEGGNEEKTAILRELKEMRSIPIMNIEISVEGKTAAESFEAFFIEYYRAAKQPLVNKALSLSVLAEKGRETFIREVDMLSVLEPPSRSFFQQWRLNAILLFLPSSQQAQKERTYQAWRARLRQTFNEHHRYAYFRPINPYHLLVLPEAKNAIIARCVKCQEPLLRIDEQGSWQSLICSCRSENSNNHFEAQKVEDL